MMGQAVLNEYNLCVVISGAKLAVLELGRSKSRPACSPSLQVSQKVSLLQRDWRRDRVPVQLTPRWEMQALEECIRAPNVSKHNGLDEKVFWKLGTKEYLSHIIQ